MKSHAAFARLAERRRRNPVREARRQAHLSKASRRIDFVPRYRALSNGREVVAQKYLGHVAVRAR